MSQPGPCAACGAPDQAAFCRACGAPRDAAEAGAAASRPGRRGRRGRPERTRRASAYRDVRRALAAETRPVQLIFLGTLGLLFGWYGFLPEPESELGVTLFDLGFQSCVLLLGLAVWLASRRPEDEPLTGSSLGGPRGLLLGMGLGVLGLGLNLAWMLPLASALGEELPGFGVPEGFGLLLLSTAVGPALVEELTCRGILWSALGRSLAGWSLVLTTAVLFALLHGLNGGGPAELPPRLLIGLVYGWLRWRTGSIAPAMVAHFTNNALALLILE